MEISFARFLATYKVKDYHVEVKRLPHYGNCLVSKDKIDPGTILLEIPRTLFICMEEVLKNELFRKWHLDFHTRKTIKMMLFIAFLFFEQHKRKILI